MKDDSAIKSLVVLTLICLVVTAALALTNNVTRPVIEAASAERETVARLEFCLKLMTLPKLPMTLFPMRCPASMKQTTAPVMLSLLLLLVMAAI